MPKCETLESIEQLRIISYGFNLLSVNQINEVPSINEKEDLEKFHEYLIANPTEKEITKNNREQIIMNNLITVIIPFHNKIENLKLH